MMTQAFNIDCMEYMKTVSDGYFDLAVVDPPYGRKEHGGKKRSQFVKQKADHYCTLRTAGMKRKTGTMFRHPMNTLPRYSA